VAEARGARFHHDGRTVVTCVCRRTVQLATLVEDPQEAESIGVCICGRLYQAITTVAVRELPAVVRSRKE
jgi:hypothetical protein